MRGIFLAAILAGATPLGQVFATTNHAEIIAAKEVTDLALFPDRPIFTPSWDLPVDPGNPGATKTYNGTIQHAMLQMNETYPGWIKKFKEHAAAQPANSSALSKREVCRYDQWKMDVRCGAPMTGGLWDALAEGIYYLHLLEGSSGMRAGPRACGRISCSYSTAIFTCNDNPYSIDTRWFEAGDGAECIYWQCNYWGGDAQRVHGQSFSNTGNWNVIARGLDRDDVNPPDRYC